MAASESHVSQKMAAAGASLEEIARAIGVPQHVLTLMDERYFGRSKKDGSVAALGDVAAALHVSPAVAVARILTATFGSMR